MSLSKLWTALRGATNEGVEAIVDSQAIRILDQELRDAKKELQLCDQNLTSIMAKRKLAESKVNAIRADIERYSNAAVTANDAGNESLALECAEKVAQLEVDLDTEQELLDGFLKSENSLKLNIKKAKANVQRMEQQIDQVKAQESVHKAQTAVSSRHAGANSKVKTALSSLERIKQKQAQRSAELEAAEELANEESGADLDARLKSAGISPGAKQDGKDKLAALLAKRQA